MSIFSSLISVEWKDHKLNVLDTPGYADFSGDVIASLKVSDTAVFVLNATGGVEVGTELAWGYARDTSKPSMFVINHLDKEDSDFEQLVTEIQKTFGRGATVVQLPGGAGTKTIIDVLLMKQLKFSEDGKTFTTEEIDASFLERATELHNALVENIAENDESLMELYFEKGTLNEDEMRLGLRQAMIKRQLFPIFLTSARFNIGVNRLMNFIENVCPTPTQVPAPDMVAGTVSEDGSGTPAALVFRTMAEQHVGEYSFFRVYQGSVDAGVDLENAQTSEVERLNQLYTITGHERDSVQAIHSGDIGAVVKMKNTHTNNTLRQKGSNATFEAIKFPAPRYRMALHAMNQGDEDKLAGGLHQITEEDPSLILSHDTHLNQMLLSGQGERHLEIARSRLKARFGVEVEFLKPKISYRETVTKRASASYRHKKQTGGAGQFADITLLVEPLTGPFDPPANIKIRNTAETTTGWGSKIEFIDGIVGGVIDMRRFFGAIQKGINEALLEGPLAGYPVGDVRVVIYDGGMHPVDSNENAFKMAAKKGFRDAFRQAGPVIMEPVHDLEVKVPETYMGDVLGDLNTRRARIMGMDADGVFQVVKAHVPESELYRYSTTLRALTHGRGIHSAAYSAYENVPRNVQDSIIASATSTAEED